MGKLRGVEMGKMDLGWVFTGRNGPARGWFCPYGTIGVG